MRKDRRGIGGFMGTMVAMMIVTITISAFMAVFAYTNLPEAEVPGISTDFLKDILVIDGEITGIDDSYVVEESERKGYRRCRRIDGRNLLQDHNKEAKI